MHQHTIYPTKTQTVTFMQVNVPAEPDAQAKHVTDTIVPTCHGTRAQDDIYRSKCIKILALRATV